MIPWNGPSRLDGLFIRLRIPTRFDGARLAKGETNQEDMETETRLCATLGAEPSE